MEDYILEALAVGCWVCLICCIVGQIIIWYVSYHEKKQKRKVTQEPS